MENQKQNSDEQEDKRSERSNYLIPSRKKLYKSPHNYILFGVCGGIGEYLSINPILVRLLFVITSLLGGWGIIAYIVSYFLIPEHPSTKEKGITKKLLSQRAFGFLLIGIGAYYWLPPFGIFKYIEQIEITNSIFLTGLLIIFGIIILIKGSSKEKTVKEKPNKLYRSKENKRLLGVCSGLADYMQTDVNLLRLLLILFSFITLGVVLLLYLLVGIFLEPEKNAEAEIG